MHVDVYGRCSIGTGGDGCGISYGAAGRAVEVVGGITSWGGWGAGGGECLLGRKGYGDGVTIAAAGL